VLTQVTEFTANGQAVRLEFPAHLLDRKTPIPLVIHFQGAGDPGSALAPQWRKMADVAMNAGFALATCNFHGYSYGSPDAMADAKAVYEAALDIAPISAVVLSGNSMGGAGVLNAIGRKAVPNILGAYLVQPVVSLRHRWDNGQQGNIRTAYGIAADGSDYEAKTAGYDPALRAGWEYQGVPFYIACSYQDAQVTAVHHADVLAGLLSGYSPVERFYGTGGHGDDSQFIPADYARFLRSVAPHTDGPFNFATDASLVANFDAASLSLAGAAPVTSWAPVAGSEKAPLAQAVVEQQPVFELAAINGKPAVTFAGDYLDTGAWATVHQLPLTVLYVGNFNPANLGTLYGGRNGVYAYAGLATPDTINFGAAGTNQVNDTGNAAGWHIICAVYNGASSRFYVDSITPILGTTGTGANAALPGFKIGATSAGTTGNLTGKVAAAAILNRAVTEDEAVETMQALAAKYALTLV
jgi:hypothetical protein